MNATTIRTTNLGKKQEARPLAGIGATLYIATLNWPSLGITPDAPEYGIRTGAGPMAFSRSKAALKTWAHKNYLHAREA